LHFQRCYAELRAGVIDNDDLHNPRRVTQSRISPDIAVAGGATTLSNQTA
jgi:polyribonucleotide nucleotidyltransferase